MRQVGAEPFGLVQFRLKTTHMLLCVLGPHPGCSTPSTGPGPAPATKTKFYVLAHFKLFCMSKF